MKDYQSLLLNTLIDKFEQSKLYRGENQIAVTISFKFNKKTVPEYFNELNYQMKEHLNDIVKNLALNEFVYIGWEKYEEGNIIKQIDLNLEKVSKIYKLLNRKEKLNKEEQVLEILLPYLAKNNYLATFSKSMIETVKTGKSISKYLDMENPSLIRDILFTIDHVLDQKDEISKRVFSIKLFNNSKYFESIENKVLKIMKNYGDYIEETDILAEENIVRNPGYVYLKGHGNLSVAMRELIFLY